MKSSELFDLSGQSALVTGASSGLGRQFAKTLSANGAHVWLAARRIERLMVLKKEIEEAGGSADVLELDVANAASITDAFKKIQEKRKDLSIVINNAGISGGGSLLSQSDEDWKGVLDVNLEGVRLVGIQAAKQMIDQGTEGQIVNIASILGYSVAKGLSAYAVAKAGVIQLTKAMALEFVSKNINVNAMAPGYICTEINRGFFDTPQGEKMIGQIPMKRLGDASDLDATLLLLSSRKASGFMTGSIITIDGGHLLSVV